MIRRIKNLERIDPASLPEPMSAGFARWQFEVDFWDVETEAEAIGPAHATDLITMERPTQTAIFRNGQWELRTPEEQLTREIDRTIDSYEPTVWGAMLQGARGRLYNENREIHGKPTKTPDPLLGATGVRALEAKKASPHTQTYKRERGATLAAIAAAKGAK